MTENNFISPFFTSDALAVTAKHFPLLTEDESIPIDVPLALGRRYFLFKTVGLVGGQYADYSSVMSPENTFDCIGRLSKDKYSRHIIEFGNISEHDVSLSKINDWIKINNLLCIKKCQSKAPYLTIDCTWDEYVGKKKKKFWYNISRGERLLRKKGGDVSFKRLGSPKEILVYLDRCMALYNENWNKFTSGSIFIRKKGYEFLKDLLLTLSEKDNMELCLIEQGNEILSFSVGFMCDSRYFFYIFSTTKKPRYATYSVGKIHISHLLKSVFERGFKSFDFMAGEEPYKYEWTKISQNRFTYYVMNRSWINRLLMSSFYISGKMELYLKNSTIVRQTLKYISRIYH